MKRQRHATLDRETASDPTTERLPDQQRSCPRASGRLEPAPAAGQLLRGALGTVPAANHDWKQRQPPPATERAADAAAVGRRRPPAASLQQLRVEIAKRLGRGDSLERVECELIAPSRLSEEQQSALWLYGWSLPKPERRRAALPHLESVAREQRQRPRASYLAGDDTAATPAQTECLRNDIPKDDAL
jgi:hypothetical protein